MSSSVEEPAPIRSMSDLKEYIANHFPAHCFYQNRILTVVMAYLRSKSASTSSQSTEVPPAPTFESIVPPPVELKVEQFYSIDEAARDLCSRAAIAAGSLSDGPLRYLVLYVETCLEARGLVREPVELNLNMDFGTAGTSERDGGDGPVSARAERHWSRAALARAHAQVTGNAELDAMATASLAAEILRVLGNDISRDVNEPDDSPSKINTLWKVIARGETGLTREVICERCKAEYDSDPKLQKQTARMTDKAVERCKRKVRWLEKKQGRDAKDVWREEYIAYTKKMEEWKECSEKVFPEMLRRAEGWDPIRKMPKSRC